MRKLCHGVLRLDPMALDASLPKISVGRFGSCIIKYVNQPENIKNIVLTIETPDGNTFSVNGEDGEFYVKPGMLDSAGVGKYYVMAKDDRDEVTPLGSGILSISIYPTAAASATSTLPVSSVMDVNGVSRQLLAVQDETGAWTLTVGKIIDTPDYSKVDVSALPEDLTAKDSMAKIKAAVNAIKKAVAPTAMVLLTAFTMALNANAETLENIAGDEEVYTAEETEVALAALELKMVKSVNGAIPDDAGNVEISTGSDKAEVEGIIEEKVTKEYVENLGIAAEAGVTSIDGKTGALVLKRPEVTSHNIGVSPYYSSGTKIATISISKENHEAIKVMEEGEREGPIIKAVVPPEFYDIYAPIPDPPSLETLGAASAGDVASLASRVSTAESAASSADTKATAAGTKADAAKTAAEAAQGVADAAKLTSDRVLAVMTANENVWFEATNYYGMAGIPASMQLYEKRDGQTKLVWDQRNWVRWHVDSALAGKASELTDSLSKWSSFQSFSGEANPLEDTTWISTPRVALSGGFEWQKTTLVKANVFVLHSNGLAAISSPTEGSFFSVEDLDGTSLLTVKKTADQTLAANASAVSVDGQSLIVTYNVAAAEHPTLHVCLSLAENERVWYEETDSDCPCTVTWRGASGNWVATVEPKYVTTSIFAYAHYVKQGQTLIEMNGVAGASKGFVCSDDPSKIVKIIWNNGNPKFVEVQ